MASSICVKSLRRSSKCARLRLRTCAAALVHACACVCGACTGHRASTVEVSVCLLPLAFHKIKQQLIFQPLTTYETYRGAHLLVSAFVTQVWASLFGTLSAVRPPVLQRLWNCLCLSTCSLFPTSSRGQGAGSSSCQCPFGAETQPHVACFGD